MKIVGLNGVAPEFHSGVARMGLKPESPTYLIDQT